MVEDPHAALRRDVDQLGRLLGETLAALEGQALFDRVESVRKLAKQARDGQRDARRRLDAQLRELSAEQAMPVVRAFGHFLALANIAEQHHRVRRRRQRLEDPGAAPQRGSLDETFGRLCSSGIEPAQLRRSVIEQRVELVLTAHPTEVTRRTLLLKQRRVADLLDQQDQRDATSRARHALEVGLRREIAAIWGTDEIRPRRPTPEDEALGGLSIIEQVLWDVVPTFFRQLDDALVRHTGQGLPANAAPIRFGSWMGGDRDGNPNVTAEVTRRVCLRARVSAAKLYAQQVRALEDELSINTCDDELRARVGSVWEPYRELLKSVRERLDATARRAQALLDGRRVAAQPEYRSVDELRAPLQLCYRSLCRTGFEVVARDRLRDLLWRVACFGLTLHRLDLRQEAQRHTDALDAITRHLEMGAYGDWDEDERRDFLVTQLESKRPLVPRDFRGDEQVQEVLGTFAVAAELGAESLGAYVISMASRPSDVLAVVLLQRELGVHPPMRVVPLFETPSDLEAAGACVRTLLELPCYRDRIDDRQEVMIGYSDSAKRSGRLAAGWSLYRAQEDLVRVCHQAGVELTIFHGRGGSVGRGGGSTHTGVVSQPPGAIDGTLRVTEQGEVIHAKFGIPGVAARTLELYTTSVVEASLLPAPKPEPSWRALMDEMAATSKQCFEQIVSERSDLVAYFRAVTPAQELGKLNIASRPARRRSDGGLESLRAIPWVFAWTQIRAMLPAWLGIDDALRQALQRGHRQTLEQMVERWPFFRETLAMIEMVLAKASSGVWHLYHELLAPEETRELGEELQRRLRRTRELVLQVVGHETLLEDDPVLARSIAVRNPYVDPLNVLQAELLCRARAQAEPEPALRRALLLTVNGIAAGMRNTG